MRLGILLSVLVLGASVAYIFVMEVYALGVPSSLYLWKQSLWTELLPFSFFREENQTKLTREGKVKYIFYYEAKGFHKLQAKPLAR